MWRIEPLADEGMALVTKNEIDWAYQNKLRQEWLEANPDAKWQGWMSI
jgi:hypothetical protein